MTHTKGKWDRVCVPSCDKYNIRHISGEDCQKIATIAHPVGMDQGEALANARLISAAPDLLQACQNALAKLDYQDKVNALPIAILDAMQEIRAAIALTKG